MPGNTYRASTYAPRPITPSSNRWIKYFLPSVGGISYEPTIIAAEDVSTGVTYQYIFWQATATLDLMEVYNDGTGWHGPFDLQNIMGHRASEGLVWGAPSATIDSSDGTVTVAWQGQDGYLWYTQNFNGFQPRQLSWTPDQEVVSWGQVGGQPSVAEVPGTGQPFVFWTPDVAWGAISLWFGVLGGTPSAPHNLGVPVLYGSVRGIYSSISAFAWQDFARNYEVGFQGGDGNLWIMYLQYPLDISSSWTYTGPHSIGNTGQTIGTAPACSTVVDSNASSYCYWGNPNDGSLMQLSITSDIALTSVGFAPIF